MFYVKLNSIILCALRNSLTLGVIGAALAVAANRFISPYSSEERIFTIEGKDLFPKFTEVIFSDEQGREYRYRFGKDFYYDHPV